MSEALSTCPTCGAGLTTGKTPDGWTWCGCSVAGGAHYSTTYRDGAAVVTPAEAEDLDLLVFDAFAAGLTLTLDSTGALEIGGTGTLSPELLSRIEASAARLVEYLSGLPWNLGRDAEALAEREAARRTRPHFLALSKWVAACGPVSDWLDSLGSVRLGNGRTVGDGKPGGIRRLIHRMLDDPSGHREDALALTEALELIPPSDTQRSERRHVLNVLRQPDAPGSPVDAARRWREAGTLDTLPDRLAVDALTEWNAPGPAIRHSLAVLDRGGDPNEIEAARDHLFDIVRDVARWLDARTHARGEAA
jgi:hypothetical protein